MNLFSDKPIWNNAIFILRVWVGVIFIRYGLSIWHQSNMQDFAETLKAVNIPIPLLSAYLCKSTEFFGGIFLVIGFLKRPACIFLIIDMTVATFVFHKGLFTTKRNDNISFVNLLPDYFIISIRQTKY